MRGRRAVLRGSACPMVAGMVGSFPSRASLGGASIDCARSWIAGSSPAMTKTDHACHCPTSRAVLSFLRWQPAARGEVTMRTTAHMRVLAAALAALLLLLATAEIAAAQTPRHHRLIAPNS